jgi:hypothetical protein
LAATRRLIERLAATTDGFGALGLVTPFPGTALYRRFARQYGFVRWWLDRPRVTAMQAPLPARGAPPDATWPATQQALEEALLDADFFRYSSSLRQAIRETLAFRRSIRVGS